MHALRKLCGTVRLLACLGMARTFGRYQHTVWDGTFSYARYRWRNQTWCFPTSAVDDE